MGSKSRIADALMDALPAGKRFVDLFGGGFAMSHKALLSGKYESVWYNDIEPLLVQLIKDAIAGKYSYENFTPEWISREEFFKRKDSDGYVKYIWSFGNGGKCYMFGRDIEEQKRKGHELVIHGVPFDGFEAVGDTFTERRLNLKKQARERRQRIDVEQLERLQQLEQLERLEQLEQLERLQQLQITCMDYRDYEYQPGDVVYCDIPYESREKYGAEFDHAAFYDWAATRDYPVYFSSFDDITDSRFPCVWVKPKRSLLAQGGRDTKLENECLYVNDAGINENTEKGVIEWAVQISI